MPHAVYKRWQRFLQMITDASRYMITDASVVVLDAPVNTALIKKTYWSEISKIKSFGAGTMNKILYSKPLKNALFMVLHHFFKRRETLMKHALTVSVYYDGKKGTDVTPEGCEHKLKEYLDCLQSIVLFYEANRKRIDKEGDEAESEMRRCRKSIIEMVTKKCHFIKMSNEYKDVQTGDVPHESSAMFVKAQKARAWLEIGNLLETTHLELKATYEEYCKQLFYTINTIQVESVDENIALLLTNQAKEPNAWSKPDCLKNRNY